jgi:hypothetical protein
MAKLCAYYSLCPLIDQTSLLGIAEDSTSGCVIVTLGKNIVIRYKLSSQKQIGSWSSKGKLSSPVVYDAGGNRYIAVFSRNELRLWTEHEENLDKVKKMKFQQQIHCVIAQKNGKEPLILFSNGAVCPLSTAVGTRKEGNNTSLLDVDEIIEDCHLVTDEICTFVTVLCRSSSDVPHFCVVPVSGSIASVKLKVERKGFHLVGRTIVQHTSSCNFLTLWSDGKLYSLPFHPQPSPELPGSFVNTVRAVSTKHPVALLALSSSHVAVYGADPSEEGASLIIYNVQFGVVQSRYHFKLFALPPRLWCAGSSLLIAAAHNLVVVPYQLEAQQLSALVGAHCSDGTADCDVQELHYTPCASWVAESTTADMCCQPNQQVPEAIKEELAALQADGCCQSVLRIVPFHHALSLLHHLTAQFEAHEPEVELHNLVEWASLLLDAHYQRCLLSGDPQVLALLHRIHKLVNDQIAHMNDLKGLLPILQQFQEGRLSVKKTQGANKLYCVEYLRLY